MGNIKQQLHRMPVKASESTILEAVREHRKPQVQKHFNFYLIGLKREGVEPQALVVNEELLYGVGQPPYYAKDEYDIIAHFNDYKGFIHNHKMTTQKEVVTRLAYAVRGWEIGARREYKAQK